MTALITGASSGIGAELALEFAKDKIDLILVARREDRLKQIATTLSTNHGIKVTVIALDLSLAGSAEELYKKVKSLRLSVDYLVNNAGFGDNGEFVECDLPLQEDMINLNILTLTKLTHLFGADISLKVYGAGKVTAKCLKKSEAKKVYQLCLDEITSNSKRSSKTRIYQ